MLRKHSLYLAMLMLVGFSKSLYAADFIDVKPPLQKKLDIFLADDVLAEFITNYNEYFRPENPITREEFIRAIIEYREYSDSASENNSKKLEKSIASLNKKIAGINGSIAGMKKQLETPSEISLTDEIRNEIRAMIDIKVNNRVPALIEEHDKDRVVSIASEEKEKANKETIIIGDSLESIKKPAKGKIFVGLAMMLLFMGSQ